MAFCITLEGLRAATVIYPELGTNAGISFGSPVGLCSQCVKNNEKHLQRRSIQVKSC